MRRPPSLVSPGRLVWGVRAAGLWCQLSGQTLVWVLLRTYFSDVISTYNQSTLSKAVTPFI